MNLLYTRVKVTRTNFPNKKLNVFVSLSKNDDIIFFIKSHNDDCSRLDTMTIKTGEEVRLSSFSMSSNHRRRKWKFVAKQHFCQKQERVQKVLTFLGHFSLKIIYFFPKFRNINSWDSELDELKTDPKNWLSKVYRKWPVEQFGPEPNWKPDLGQQFSYILEARVVTFSCFCFHSIQWMCDILNFCWNGPEIEKWRDVAS